MLIKFGVSYYVDVPSSIVRSFFLSLSHRTTDAMFVPFKFYQFSCSPANVNNCRLLQIVKNPWKISQQMYTIPYAEQK